MALTKCKERAPRCPKAQSYARDAEFESHVEAAGVGSTLNCQPSVQYSDMIASTFRCQYAKRRTDRARKLCSLFC
jgi:hypothetical protein